MGLAASLTTRWPAPPAARASAILVVRYVRTGTQIANILSHHLHELDGHVSPRRPPSQGDAPKGGSGPWSLAPEAAKVDPEPLAEDPQAGSQDREGPPGRLSASAAICSTPRIAALRPPVPPPPARAPGSLARPSASVPAPSGLSFLQAVKGPPCGRTPRRMAADRPESSAGNAKR